MRRFRISAFLQRALVVFVVILLLAPWGGVPTAFGEVATPGTPAGNLSNEQLSNNARQDGSGVLPGNTPVATVEFYALDKSGEYQLVGTQRVVSGDKIQEPAYPGRVPNQKFLYWAKKPAQTTSEGAWAKKDYNFSQEVTVTEPHTISIYAQYEAGFSVRFIFPKVNGPDRVLDSHTVVNGECGDPAFSDAPAGGSEGKPEESASSGCKFASLVPQINPSFLPEGMVVKGWTRDRQAALDPKESDSTLVPDEEVVTKTDQFYLVMTEGFTVTFDSMGGSQVANAVVFKGDKLAADALPTPRKSGYTFKGWSSKQGEYVPFDLNQEINESITLYAFWEPAETSFRVDYLVESLYTRDKNGKRAAIPMVYGVYKKREDKESSNIENLDEDLELMPELSSAADEEGIGKLADEREGSYELQFSQRHEWKDEAQRTHWVTGDKPDPNELCKLPDPNDAADARIPSSFNTGAFEIVAEKADKDKVLAGDGSTTFTCKLRRKRAEFRIFAYHPSNGQIVQYKGKRNAQLRQYYRALATAFKSDPKTVRETMADERRPLIFWSSMRNGSGYLAPRDAYVVRFYGVLSGDGSLQSAGTFPGEELRAAQQIALEKFQADGLEVTPVGRDKNYLYAFYKSGHLGNTDGIYFVSAPPYSDDLEGMTLRYYDTKIIAHAVNVEIAPDALVTKDTNWYQDGDGAQPAEYQSALVNPLQTQTPAQLAPRILKRTTAEGNTLDAVSFAASPFSFSFTKEDHPTFEGFKRVVLTDDEYKEMKKVQLNSLQDMTDDQVKLLKEAGLDRTLPTEANGSEYQHYAGVFAQKRLSYNLRFDTNDVSGKTPSFEVPIPYDYTVNETINTHFAKSDSDVALNKVRALKEKLAQFKPEETKRSDGYKFVGWCADANCASGPIDLDTFTMPAHDTILVAKWEPIKRTLRVFYDANDQRILDASEYLDKEFINPSDYLKKEKAPTGHLGSAEFLGWLYRPRYVTVDAAGNERVRYGVWRDYPAEGEVQMNSDIDMRPHYRSLAYKVTYLPGLTDANGQPTGPSGRLTDGTNKPTTTADSFAYAPDIDAQLIESGFTAPDGYWFGGWYAEDGKTIIFPGHAIEMYQDRTLRARWLPTLPTAQLTYHANYPIVTMAEDISTTKPVETNSLHDVQGLPSSWEAPAGWEFVGWSPDPSTKVPEDPNAEWTAPYVPASAEAESVPPNHQKVLLNHRHNNHLYALWRKIQDVTIYVEKGTQVPAAEAGERVNPEPGWKRLDGAQFALYRVEENGESRVEDGVKAVQSERYVNDTWVAGPQFVLEKVKPGRYRLVETQTPSGYQLQAQATEFTVTNDAKVQVSVGGTLSENEKIRVSGQDNESEHYLIKVANQPSGWLPLTGGPGILLFAGIGLIAMLLGFSLRSKLETNSQ